MKYNRYLLDSMFFLPVIVLGLVFSMFIPNFGNWDNITVILSQAAPLIIITLAQMFVLLSGGFDISVGSIAAMVSVVLAISSHHTNFLGAICIALLCGALLGAFNGLNVSLFGVQPVIATLGMLLLGRGLALIIAPSPISGLPKQLLIIGYESFLGIPISVWIALLFVILMEILINRSAWGRALLATGGSEKAAGLNGIFTRRIKFSAYLACGILTAFAAILYTARANSGQPNLGVGLELDTITAAVIGGVSLLGGKGRAIGACAGALILAELANGMSLANVSPFIQQVITGAALVFFAIFLFKKGLMKKMISRRSRMRDENLNGEVINASKIV
jgi:ribose transport system permease protein